MSVSENPSYRIEGRQLIAETPDLRVQILTLADGEEVPWHYYNDITDSFVWLDGPMRVETRAPHHDYWLAAGESCEVPVRTAHRVSGAGGCGCRFVIVQGVASYDFVPVTQSR